MLHRPVLFIGDKPSKANIDQNVPFVGTKSYKTLLNWIADMDIDIGWVDIRNSADITYDVLKTVKEYNGAIICLGKAACNAVASKLAKNEEIVVFKLPHPSGLNRALNDKKKLAKLLQECKNYIYEDKK